LTLQVLKDGETLQELIVDDAELAAASAVDADMEVNQRADRLLMAQFMLVFSPIHFDGPCVLKVRVQTESGELRGMALKVDALPAMLAPDPD
jgi:hypothetical protein